MEHSVNRMRRKILWCCVAVRSMLPLICGKERGFRLLFDGIFDGINKDILFNRHDSYYSQWFWKVS